MNFKDFINLYEKVEKEKIKTLLDSNGFIFFFKHNKELYATDEDNRLTFARMKNPDKEDDKKWRNETDFSGFSLDSALIGTKKNSFFNYKDIKNIKVIQKEKAYEELLEKANTIDKKNKLKIMIGLNSSEEINSHNHNRHSDN